MKKQKLNRALGAIILVLVFMSPITEAYSQYRPDVFFREDWKETPPATPLTPEHVANQDLELSLYGPAAGNIRKSNHHVPEDDPFYVWSGQAEGNWAVTLKKTGANVDLTEHANIKWRTKQSGLRCLYLILKLADGPWLISDQCDGPSGDWQERQFNIDDIRWRALDIEDVVEGRPVEDPDLSAVEEVGFTDLMRGGGTAASSRVDWIEVYGKSIDY